MSKTKKKNRRNLIGTIRKLIGPGKTFAERGQVWMTFARGKKAWNIVVKNLTKKFPQTPGKLKWIVSQNPKVTITLKSYEKGTNNIVDIYGIYKW